MTRCEIVVQPEAARDIESLRKYDAAAILDGIEQFLGHQPTHESRSRIKRLRGTIHNDFRLRIGDFRFFYSVEEVSRRVTVLRVLAKKQTVQYYRETEL